MSPKFVEQKHLKHANGQGREASTSPIDRASKLRSEPEELIALYKPAQKRISTTGAAGGRRNYKDNSTA